MVTFSYICVQNKFHIMKTVRFNIKKLGAIENSSIELSPMMVFSGESGLGKSYVSFLVHYLYTLLTGDRLNKFFTDKGYNLTDLLHGKQSNETILKIPVSEVLSWINRDAVSYIGYLLGHDEFSADIEIEFPFMDNSFEFVFDKEVVGLDNNEDVICKILLNSFTYRFSSDKSTLEADPLTGLVTAVLSKAIFNDHLFLKRSYLMPPSRGALLELNERPVFLSGMYEEFFDFKNDLNRPLKEVPKIEDSLIQCLSDVNHGDIQQTNGRLMYYTNGVEIPVTAAASSVKELAPLTLLLKKYSTLGTSVLLEEPEAHLHPGRQVKVADLIGCAVQKGCHVQMTTHSDYLLKRLNNLIMLYFLKDRDADSFETISKKWNIKKECLIDPKLIGAYLLVRNEDGSSRIEKQEVTEDGIPFESFYQVIEDDITMSNELRNALQL